MSTKEQLNGSHTNRKKAREITDIMTLRSFIANLGQRSAPWPLYALPSLPNLLLHRPTFIPSTLNSLIAT